MRVHRDTILYPIRPAPDSVQTDLTHRFLGPQPNEARPEPCPVA
jgi:hypothetical protein